MVNRSQAPITPPFPPLRLPAVEHSFIQPGLPLTIVRDESQPIIILSINYRAGNLYASRAGMAGLMAKMLPKGTTEQSAEYIADQIEYYGGRLESVADQDLLKINLEVPSRHFHQLLPILQQVVATPAFPLPPFEKLKKITAQKIQQNLLDPQKHGYQRLRQAIFGPDHPYGRILQAESLEVLTIEEIKKHHATYHWNQPEIFLYGDVTQEVAEATLKAFERIKIKSLAPPQSPASVFQGENLAIKMENSPQTTINLGHPTIKLTDPDYIPLYITTKLLGGYFGSRLMANIREKNGFTYGIHSYINPFWQQSYWRTTTVVNKKHTEATCREILHEIKRLQETPIGKEPLQHFKNYLLGELLGSFEGPLEIEEQLEAVALHKLGLTYYQQLYQGIKEITPVTIQQTAQRYLGLPTLKWVRVG